MAGCQSGVVDDDGLTMKRKEIGTIERLRSMAYAGMPADGDIVQAAADSLYEKRWRDLALCVLALGLRVCSKAHGKGKG